MAEIERRTASEADTIAFVDHSSVAAAEGNILAAVENIGPVDVGLVGTAAGSQAAAVGIGAADCRSPAAVAVMVLHTAVDHNYNLLLGMGIDLSKQPIARTFRKMKLRIKLVNFDTKEEENDRARETIRQQAKSLRRVGM